MPGSKERRRHSGPWFGASTYAVCVICERVVVVRIYGSRLRPCTVPRASVRGDRRWPPELKLSMLIGERSPPPPTAATAEQPSPGSPSRSSRYGADSRERRLVDQIFTSWNPLISWLRNVAALGSAVGSGPSWRANSHSTVDPPLTSARSD
jgi:hypothetical protein